MVQAIAVAGGTHAAQQLEVCREALIQPARDLERAPDREGRERARRAAQVHAQRGELASQPGRELRGAGRLAGAVAAHEGEHPSARDESLAFDWCGQSDGAREARRDRPGRGVEGGRACERPQPQRERTGQHAKAPARRAGQEGVETTLEQAHRNGRQVPLDRRHQLGPLGARLEALQLPSHRRDPVRAAAPHDIPHGAALRRLEHRQQQLVLGRGRAHHEARARCGEHRFRERHGVRRAPRGADHDPMIGVHVDQWPRFVRLLVAQIAVHGGQLQPGWGDGALEAELHEHLHQGGPRGGVDQEVQVAGTRQPAVPFGVTLPLAVRDAGTFQRGGESLDERRRGLPDRRAQSLSGRHGDARSRARRGHGSRSPRVARRDREWPVARDSRARPRTAGR